MSSQDFQAFNRPSTPQAGSFEKQNGSQEVGTEEPMAFKLEESTYPEGGVRAWIVVLGACLTMFVTFGWANSWGVFQEFYETHQLRDQTPSAISWIGSMQIFFLFSGSLFGGPLFDIYGEKVLWMSAPLYLVAVFMTSICKEYYQFMLAQGILGGLGMGFTMAPCITATSHYFNKNRGAALGLVIAGSSLGGIVWPIVLNKLLHSSISFGWSVRICAFVMVAFLLVAVAGIKARLPPRKGAFFLFHAFKDPQYVSIVVAVFLATIGVFVPIFYLPTYAVMHGMSIRMAFYLISILNGASFLGRVIPGLTADKFGPLNMLFVATVSTGILTLCWTKITSNTGIIFFAGIYGFCSGAIVSLMSVSLTRVPKDPRQMGTYMGMGMFVVAVAALIGPPINGALVTKYHGFEQSSIFSGVFILIGGSVVILAKWTTGKGIFAKI